MSSLNISYNEIWKDVQNRFIVSGIKYHYCTYPELGNDIKFNMIYLFSYLTICCPYDSKDIYNIEKQVSLNVLLSLY